MLVLGVGIQTLMSHSEGFVVSCYSINLSMQHHTEVHVRSSCVGLFL